MAGTTAAPYGLVPVRRADGLPFSGNTNLYRIQSGYATAIYNGQPVRYSGGYITTCSAADLGTTATPDTYVGVFVGCTYTDPNTLQKVWKQYYPASTVASDIQAYVVDDPTTVFRIQANSTAFDVLANIGKNFALSSATAGSATTGNSTIALDTDGTPAANANLPFKIMGLWGDPTNTNAATGYYLDILVRINPAFHVLSTNAA